jgi:hypothetical protein
MFMSTQSLLFLLAASSASWDTARCVAAFEGQQDELVSSNKNIARNTRVRISTFDDPTKGQGGQSNIKSDPRAMEDLRDLSTFLFEITAAAIGMDTVQKRSRGDAADNESHLKETSSTVNGLELGEEESMRGSH